MNEDKQPDRPDEWFRVAERLGNQLANNIEKFGDKVQKVVESLDEKVRSEPSVTVEDARTTEGGPAFSSLRAGQAFEHGGQLFLRLGALPEADVHNLAVNLNSGRVQAFAATDEAAAVRVKVTLQNPGPSEKSL